MELTYRLDEIAGTASQVLKAYKDCHVFAFYGEMGAGKTTFIHAFGKAMGVRDVISSPTFSIINQYSLENGQVIYHIDLFRIENEEEALQAGVEDCLISGEYCFVEWPGKVPGIIPDNAVTIHITTIGANTRKLEINM